MGLEKSPREELGRSGIASGLKIKKQTIRTLGKRGETGRGDHPRHARKDGSWAEHSSNRDMVWTTKQPARRKGTKGANAEATAMKNTGNFQ